MSRYECTLSDETLRKAVTELNEPEDNEVRLQAIDSLRTRFEESCKDSHIIRTDDAFILRYLRFRKFNEERALKAMKKYHHLRKTWRDVFDLVDNPHLISDFLDIGSVVPLKTKAKDGTFVSIGRPGRNFDRNCGITEFIAVTILTTETLLEDEEMQIHGITVIEDLKCFSIGLSMQMAVVARQFINLMQDALPVRIKSLNVVYESLAYDIIYAAIRPFLNEKLRKRMQLHGSEMKTLHAKIDEENLPAFLGGTGPELDVAWWKGETLKRVNTEKE